MAAFDAEVAGQSAASSDGVDVGAGRGEQGGVGVPAEDGVVVAVGLCNAVDPGEVRWPVAVGAGEQLGQGLGGGGDGRRPRVIGQQGGDVVAERCGAGGFESDDRDALARERAGGP